jgi:S1-C subfamily serine protease
MADVHGPKGLAGSAPKIAIGAALAAVLMSLLAVIVVVSRDGGAIAPAARVSSSGEANASASAKPGSDPPPPEARRVAAADLLKLRGEAVSVARDAGKVIGVRVDDEDVRAALGLSPDDVITALSGRAIERELDVFEAIFGLKRMHVSSVYAELLRDGKPVLVRWRVDGDLQAVRGPDPFDPRGTLGSLGGGLGSLGGSSSTGGVLGSDPFAPARDPLADTIEKVDDLRYEVPRATVERVFASPSAYRTLARALPVRHATGFRLFGIRPGSILWALGISSGDTIRALNGNAVSSPDEVVELYPQIKDASEWRVDLDRRGKPILLTIVIK